MNFEIIDVSQTTQSESYIIISSDGRITLHVETENNTVAYLHKTSEEITLADLRQRNPRLAERVEAALMRLCASVPRDASAP